jgi:predicted  nucleic acid-binding Zn-ribbon protein
MRRDFLNSDITLRDLAKRHGCSYRYVSGLSSQERWYPQRRELKAQQESAVTEELVERVAAKSAELAQLKALTAEEHVSRSLQVGEQLQQALAALEAQDVRQLKTAIEAWSTWDKQMRANHQIESEKVEKPLIDINVMAALPRRAELERQQKEGKTVIELKAA